MNANIFSLGTFCSQLMNELLQIVIYLEDGGDRKTFLGSDKALALERWLGLWQTIANGFECDGAEAAITRLRKKISNGARFGDVEYGLRAVNEALTDGLKNQFVYRYPRENVTVLKSWKEDWEAALRAFPSASTDAFAATDLWALGHFTASVFHSMRVLECGLSELATELSVNPETQNWQNIIDQIESAVRQEQRVLPRGEARNQRLQFLAEAAKEFIYFKDGWRNYVSHNKGLYSEVEARSVLEHVRQFMSILATKRPKPVGAGGRGNPSTDGD